MKKSKQSKDVFVINASNLSASETIEAQRIQNEHEEKTIWRKDIIMTTAKAASLTALSIACAIAICLAVKLENNELLEHVARIIMCVLSFFAGRSTNRQNKD